MNKTMHHTPIRTYIILIAILFFGSTMLAANGFYDVTSFGAVSDGQTKATKAIAKAIGSASEKGGGTIFFPAGKYLTGPIVLKSNITIFLDAGAVLTFSDDFDDYLPMVQSRWEGTDVMNFSPLFYAFRDSNITITGRGRIDGQGKKWWDYHHWLYSQPKDFKSKWQKEFAKQNKAIILPDQPGMVERGFLRPPFIQPMYCKNVRIEGITITNSPFWTINPEFCENVTVTNVTINNPESPNTDGINPESCRYVHISNCHISVGDDCITIKSGKDGAGRNMAAPCENITIANCTMLRGHGGVVIGSEMSGDVKKVTISNCVFEGTDRGIRIKSTRGRGGVVEDIRVSNIIMKDIRKEAIKLNMFYSKTEPEPVSERTPVFRNIHFSNLTGNAYQAGFLLGLDEMKISNITFNDIQLDSKVGFTLEDASDIEFHNVKIDTRKGSPIYAKDSENLIIEGVRTDTPEIGVAVIELVNVQNAFIYNCFQTKETDLFLKLAGEHTKAIYSDQNNFANVKTKIIKTDNVKLND
ncbi:glycoside hydrolase family 28 protein [Saccharicrinis sp. FJH54]|uniref:glycoside hydrolase family 28 protein n=1 Tax=Saccharicrinis sp. FJH54 TaxID=3344665 RepID=UPI0035D40BE1